MTPSVWAGRPPLVLVVDDQEANIRLLGTVLSDAGFDVMPADSGKRALSRMEAANPDVILLDMRMPIMDGFEVLERLKSNPDWADIPVVFITAAHERDLLIKAFDGGAVDYIAKPFVAEELIVRVKTHAELKRSRDQLHMAIREREDLATIVAHDLKNPLFNISLNANLLATELDDGSEPQKRAKSIESSAKKALEFVERYLERRASVELRRGYEAQSMAVEQLLQMIADEFSDEAARRAQSLQVGDCGSLQVACDPDATRVILGNLLSNALKYAPEGSAIELGAAASGGNARLWVADRGPGISVSDKSKLFRRYVRLSSQPNDAAQSSGVGLAVARQEAEWMGGKLRHEDRPGGGSVFVLELPRVSAERSGTLPD